MESRRGVISRGGKALALRQHGRLGWRRLQRLALGHQLQRRRVRRRRVMSREGAQRF